MTISESHANKATWFTLRWADDHLVLLDQRRLPIEEVYLELFTVDDVVDAIRSLAVRGAPAIGMTAAWGMVLAVYRLQHEPVDTLLPHLRSAGRNLVAARPTAVNLAWAVERMQRTAEEGAMLGDIGGDGLVYKLIGEARRIQDEDEAASQAMGEALLAVLGPAGRILTHCNAGQLAASRYGTALAPIYVGVAQGRRFHVFADETRPILQGARLTAWELAKLGVDVTLLCDNMAATVMSQKKVDAVIVGADRIAANGDVANKIGTLGVAILARHFGIPFYVAAPMSTIDFSLRDGSLIPIEERCTTEIVLGLGRRIAPEGIDVFNPAFDVTPNELITAIATERGVAYPPYTVSLARQRGGQ